MKTQNSQTTDTTDYGDSVAMPTNVINVQKIGYFTKTQPLTVTTAGPGTSC